MTESKKKSISINRKKLLLIAIAIFVVIAGFIGYRWYKISHPYNYVSFTTFVPRDQQPQDVMLHLQGYTQDIFSFGDSYLPQRISLTYTLPKDALHVIQTKSAAPTLSDLQCSQETSTEDCTLVKQENGMSFIELRSDTINSNGSIQGIFLQKDTTLIRIQPTDVNRVISSDEWRTIISTTFSNLEARSFQDSPYRFFNKWNI